eukprot:9598266-Alexandrium_andersonii.AAC.1
MHYLPNHFKQGRDQPLSHIRNTCKIKLAACHSNGGGPPKRGDTEHNARGPTPEPRGRRPAGSR